MKASLTQRKELNPSLLANVWHEYYGVSLELLTVAKFEHSEAKKLDSRSGDIRSIKHPSLRIGRV